MKFKKMIASIIALCLPMVETYTPFLTKSETANIVTNAESISNDFVFDADTIMPSTIKEINTNTTAPYYYEQTNTTTSISEYIPSVVTYVSCETEEKTYYNIDEKFDVEQVKGVYKYYKYIDIDNWWTTFEEMDKSSINFGGATPSNTYNPNNSTNKYYIDLYDGAELLLLEDGSAATIVAYIVPYTTTTTTTTTTETTVLPTETTTATTTAQTTSTTTTTSTTIASTVTTVSATTTVTTPIDKNVIWNGSSDTTWYDSEETEFHLYTAEELAGFSDLVNEGRTFEGQTVYLENDIYLNDVSGFDEWKSSPPANDWNSIGSSKELLFSGTLDGKNHTVYGMYDAREMGGFFGYIGSAVIQNLSLTNFYVKTTSSNTKNCAGGFVGYAVNSVTIDNCMSDGIVISDVSPYSGGFVGYAEQAVNITDCTNNGKIESRSDTLSIYSGGLLGYGKSKIIIDNCTNNGTIFSHTMNLSMLIYDKDCISGGLIGYGNAEIKNSINNGEVSSTGKYRLFSSGGLIGYGGGTIENSTNFGKVSSYSLPSINVDSEYLSGGLIGYALENVEIIDSENNGIVISSSEASSVKDYTGHSLISGGLVAYGNKTEQRDGGTRINIEQSRNNGKIEAIADLDYENGNVRLYTGGAVGYGPAYIKSFVNNDVVMASSNGREPYFCCSGGIFGLATEKSTVEESFNKGEIINEMEIYRCNCGGIIGATSTYSEVDVKNVYNLANVMGYNAGGIIGAQYNDYLKITNAYNTGNIEFSSEGGGIIGTIVMGNPPELYRTFYLSSTCSKGIGSTKVDDAIAKNEDNMKSEAFITSLGNAFVYVEDSYPKLAWEPKETIVTTTTTSSTTVTTTSTTTATDTVTSSITTTKEALSVNEDEVSLENGSQYTIQSNQENLTYVSNNLSVAVVSKNGVITAIGAGNAVITVMNSDYDVVQIMVTVTEITTVSTTLSTTTEPVTETTTTIPPEQSKTYSLGDINGDGVVDASDASQILKIYALLSTSGEVEETEEQLEAADVDKNGAVDASDASTVLTYYAHASTDFKGTFEEYLNARNEETTTIPISTTTTTEITSTTTATTTIVTETTTTPRPSPTVSGKVLTGRMLSGFQSYFYPTGDYDYIEVSWYNSAEKFTYRVGKFDNKTERITLNMNVATGGPYYLYATPYYEDGTVGEKVTFNVPTTPTNIED